MRDLDLILQYGRPWTERTVCNSDPSILIILEISANKKQAVKLKKAKINSYFFLFCTVEFDTPSFKQAQKLNELSKNDAVSFY